MGNSLYRRHAQSLDRWAGGGNGRTAMARVLGTIGSLKSARDRALPARPRELVGSTTQTKRLEAEAPTQNSLSCAICRSTYSRPGFQ
jgi:hypothetical protein